MKRIVMIAALVLVLAAVMAVPGANLYYTASWGQGCARCHEIRPNYDSWQHSSHRNVNCTSCHESSTADNLRRLRTHLSGQAPGRILLGAADVNAMTEKCRSCHQQEFAQWNAGPHSVKYDRIFTDSAHNRKRRLMDDCLRCHGMHFDGSIREVVEPVDTAGPWKLVDNSLADRAAIPCLSCHAIHREGELMEKKSDKARQESVRPSLAFFDRRSREHMPAAALPIPKMMDGEKTVRVSPDRRQGLCYQCHAPLSSGQAGTADDRTPIGVHEGISCLACHQKHAQRTQASCATCHPKMSNCGLDVEKMDTTFRKPNSRNDIHRVKCTDCHVTMPRKTLNPPVQHTSIG